MSGTAQPRALSALLSHFASFAAAHGFAVNLVVVIALAAMGAAFLTGHQCLVRYAVWFGIAFGLADWVLVQDLGFLGGLGTDPNSMIPLILLFSAGYVALSPAPHEVTAPVTAGMIAADGAGVAGVANEVIGDTGPGGRLEGLRDAVAGAGARSVGAVGALAVILLGAAPMASAAANRSADPILALAIAGSSASLDVPAPGFSLTDQHGRTVSLDGLRAKVTGVFTDAGGTWRSAGLELPGRARVQVLALGAMAGGNVALLAASRPGGNSLLAAWWDGARWTVLAPLAAGPVTAGRLRALGFGPGGSAWLLLGGGRAESIGGPGRAWRALPPMPAGTGTLAPGAGGSYDALAAAGSKLTVWRLGAGAWARVQQITVPVPYGSSG